MRIRIHANNKHQQLGRITAQRRTECVKCPSKVKLMQCQNEHNGHGFCYLLGVRMPFVGATINSNIPYVYVCSQCFHSVFTVFSACMFEEKQHAVLR